MPSLTYTLWTPRGGTAAMARIYINGGPCKAYLQRRGNRTTLVADEPLTWGDLRQDVIQDLTTKGVDPALAAALDWDGILAVCGPAKANSRPAGGTGQARHNPRLSERLVGHGMDLRKIPVEAPFRIVVDHREPQQLCDLVAAHPMAKLEVASLEIGDVIIEANGRTVVVERKAVRDFQQSVQEGHIFDQAQRIAALGDDVIAALLLEGETLGEADLTMLPQAMTGAITCLGLVQGLAVIQTLDVAHTAWALVKLAHHCTGLGYELPVHKNKPTQLLDARTYVLQSLPGISAELARRLLEHFGSVSAVIQAGDTELRQVKGMGPRTISRVREALA